MLTRRRSLTAFLLLLIGLTAVAYWPGLSGGFLFDDYPNILQQDRVHAESLDFASLKRAAGAFKHGLVGRPLATVSFAIDHAVHGKNPWGYKLTSLAVHLFNACLVMLLAGRLLALGGEPRAQGMATAFTIALVWAIHPLQVSTVLYVVQRMEMLSLGFVLLGLLVYLKGRMNQIEGLRGWPWLAAAPAMMAAGMLAKETALLLPAYTLALELTVLRFRTARADTGRMLRLAYAVMVVAGALIYFLYVVPHYVNPDVYSIREFTAMERLLTQLRVLPMYLGWIVLPQPSDFLFYYDNFPISASLTEPATTLYGALFLLALGAAAVAARKRLPLVSLGVLWFLVSHAITSNVVPLELVFEHRNYFAIMAVLLTVADLVTRIPAGRIPRLRTWTIGVAIAGLMVITLIRSATWGDPLHLAMALASNNPGSARASTDLGEQFMRLARNDARSRFYAMGIREFERGSRLPGASPMPEQGLIAFAAGAGQPADPEWWDRMAEKFRTRVIGPQEISILTGLLELRRQGYLFDDQRFSEVYRIMCERVTMPPTQYIAFGEHALYQLGDPELAVTLFIQGLERSGNDPELVAAMIGEMREQGQDVIALQLYGHARSAGIEVQGGDAPVPPAGRSPH